MSEGYVSCTALAKRNPSLQILFKRPTPAIETATRSSGFAHVCEVRNRAHFKELNFQKCSKQNEMSLAFSLPTCFAPQRRAIFDLSSDQMAPHPPL